MNPNPPYITDPTGQEHFLTGETITIGRALDNDIVITSKRVSREHACLRRDGRHVFIEDMESANGVFLNDERVLASKELRDGDRIQVGDIDFYFHDPETTIREDPFPELEIDLAGGVVRINRQIVTLSPKEFTLLAFMNKTPGRICTKDQIGEAVWPEYSESVYDYQIENLVRRLRTKLEPDPNNPLLLLTVRGMGYKLVSR